MPDKPHTDVQLFNGVGDSVTKIVFHLHPRCGDLELDDGDSYATTSLVMTMLDESDLLDAGNVVILDAYFTSLELLRRLKDRNTYTLMSVKKSYRKGIPGARLSKLMEDLQPGECIALETNDPDDPLIRFWVAGMLHNAVLLNALLFVVLTGLADYSDKMLM